MKKNQKSGSAPFSKKMGFYIEHTRYEILLLSFMFLIFGNTLSPESDVTRVVLIYQNFLVGVIVFYKNAFIRNVIISIILINLAMNAFEGLSVYFNIRSLHAILYLLFFSLVAKEVFKEVLYVTRVSRELLSAALCGFVILCLIGTFLFSFIDIYHPHSFSNTSIKADIIDDLNYFAFTTMFTLGFGDITPLTLIAKRAVMLMGLIGHFYTVFVTGIIIGKYLAVRS